MKSASALDGKEGVKIVMKAKWTSAALRHSSVLSFSEKSFVWSQRGQLRKDGEDHIKFLNENSSSSFWDTHFFKVLFFFFIHNINSPWLNFLFRIHLSWHWLIYIYIPGYTVPIAPTYACWQSHNFSFHLLLLLFFSRYLSMSITPTFKENYIINCIRSEKPQNKSVQSPSNLSQGKRLTLITRKTIYFFKKAANQKQI